MCVGDLGEHFAICYIKEIITKGDAREKERGKKRGRERDSKRKIITRKYKTDGGLRKYFLFPFPFSRNKIFIAADK